MNTSLDQLKQELLAQKSAIETKGGTVSTTYTNPSPAEITAGINSISILDTSSATATEADVLKGKTFYAGSTALKTGTLEALSETDIKLLFNNVTPDTTTVKDFHIWSGTTELHPYFMTKNKAKLNIYFNDELETLNDYAFDNCTNFSFKNLYEATNLKTICSHGMSNCTGIDLGNLPESIQTLASCAFFNSCGENCTSIKIPASIQTLGSQCLAYPTTSRKKMQNLDLSNYTLSYFADSMLSAYIFNCDFVTPASVTEIPSSFNANGGFKHITIGSQITRVASSCFAVSQDEPAENVILIDITFERETPPTFGIRPLGYASSRENLKIYVPDQSVEAYKNKAQFSIYADLIYPVSQKP